MDQRLFVGDIYGIVLRIVRATLAGRAETGSRRTAERLSRVRVIAEIRVLLTCGGQPRNLAQ